MSFKSPSYYPVDRRYKVNADVERIKGRKIIYLNTSNGKSEPYLKFAWLKSLRWAVIKITRT